MAKYIPKVRSKLLIILLFLSLAILILLGTYSTYINNTTIVQYTKNNQETFVVKRNGSDSYCTEGFKSKHFMNCVVDGRIGNQLFAVSTLIATASDSCYTPISNTALGMDKYFDVKNIVRTKVDNVNFKQNREQWWGTFAGSIAEQISPDYNWTIMGSRESFKYFIHKSNLVRSSIVFKKEIKDAVAKYFEENSLYSRTKIGIHVRRGDFTKPDNLRYGFVVSTLYFIVKAMTYFEYHLKDHNLAFLVVSDDIKWCKENIKAPNIYFSPFNDPGKDLRILTQCDHNIVTVGTFGWMGAWLNETGIVIYDKSYPRINSTLWRQQRKEDLFPEWWIGM